jgi:hypothetical protein
MLSFPACLTHVVRLWCSGMSPGIEGICAGLFSSKLERNTARITQKQAH